MPDKMHENEEYSRQKEICELTNMCMVSEEGEVFWMPLKEYRQKDLAAGMDQVLKIVCDETARECYMQLAGGQYQERLF